jgi:hypothetical protein
MNRDPILPVMRRWLFRGLCLILLALCAGAWGASYWRWAEWVGSDGRYLKVLHVGAGAGYVFGGVETRHYQSAWRGGTMRPQDTEYVTGLFRGTRYSFIGFAWDGDVSVGAFSHMWFVGAPLWFPTAVSLLLLWLVWRKTRWRKPGRGFAVAASRGW